MGGEFGMNIIDYIPEGRENAISRAELQKLTGKPDRTIRLMIKQANRELEPKHKAILSSSQARGYWVTDDVEEMERYLNESDRRRRTISANDAPIQRVVCAIKGIDLVPVKAHYRRLHKPPEPEKVLDGQIRLGG